MRDAQPCREAGDLKKMVIDQIRELVISEVITAGVKGIMGLLSPAGAMVKAAMAIYDNIVFFVDRAGLIMELIITVVDAVAPIAKGAIGGAAKTVLPLESEIRRIS